MTIKPTVLADPFCLSMRNALEKLPDLITTPLSASDKCDVIQFFAGMLMMEHFASLDLGSTIPSDQLNLALRQSLGNGHTWYSCMKFLTGVRAQSIYAEHADIFREIAGPGFMRFANHVLPDIQKNFDSIIGAR